jgi:hypothetical protein
MNSKHFILSWIACVVVVFTALWFTPKIVHMPKSGDNTEYKIVELDSCEYIMYHSVYNPSEDKLTHKGNCKYCQARLKKILNETRK